MGTNLDIQVTVARGAAGREFMVIAGLALAGVILAALAALAPWYAASPWAPARHSQVVGYDQPADASTRG